MRGRVGPACKLIDITVTTPELWQRRHPTPTTPTTCTSTTSASGARLRAPDPQRHR